MIVADEAAGGVFLFCQGTDPEVILLLEARQAGGWNSVNASSDVPNVWTVTWQPVSSSNEETQSTAGSVVPSST